MQWEDWRRVVRLGRREVLYRVDADRLDQAAQAMADLAAQWNRRLRMIKQLAEAAYAEAKTERGDDHE